MTTIITSCAAIGGVVGVLLGNPERPAYCFISGAQRGAISGVVMVAAKHFLGQKGFYASIGIISLFHLSSVVQWLKNKEELDP